MTGVYLAGLGALAAAAVVDLCGLRRLCPLLCAAASACLLVAGAGALAGHGFTVDALGADRMSGLFLVIAFGAATPISLTVRASRAGVGACCALTLGAVAVVVTARNAFVLLFAWEALTIAFYLLAGRVGGPARPRAGLITLAFGKVSGALLLVGLLLLAGRTGSFALGSFHGVPGGVLHSAAYALLVAGFGTKVGLVPMQVWMPRGYAAAPGPVRAVMAGVAVNVGFYGLWRTLTLLGSPPGWLAGALLVLAAVTALLGIAHAAVQTDLRRVIAYSSVENTGLILTGYGIALVGAAIHQPRLAAVGLLAGTLQIVAHTAAKSLLFAGGAGIEAIGGTELDRLRGAGRRAPWSGAGFTVGALTLAGLPPTAGFVSEWFLLEALMQQFRVPDLAFRLVLAGCGAAIALTAGFAAVTFIRLIGLVVLGTPAGGERSDRGLFGRAGIVALSVGCLAVAAVTPLEVRAIGAGLSPVPVAGALKSPWVLQPVFADFSILSPSWLWIAMPVLLVAVVLFGLLVSGSRMLRVRRVPAWRSATAGVEGADQYTAFAYTNPTRRILATVLGTRTELRRLDEHRLGFTSDVVEVIEDYLYRPVARLGLAIAGLVKRLQAGRLDAYIAYMLIALIGVLAVVLALA